jgi:hypothetical protein
MAEHIRREQPKQEITVSLPPGSRVVLFDDIDIDTRGGMAADAVFSDYVAQHSPGTGLLRFQESNIGRAEFLDMLDEASGIEILQNHE